MSDSVGAITFARGIGAVLTRTDKDMRGQRIDFEQCIACSDFRMIWRGQQIISMIFKHLRKEMDIGALE